MPLPKKSKKIGEVKDSELDDKMCKIVGVGKKKIAICREKDKVTVYDIT